ncbi:MAG: lactate racemase domain-containing protein [Candidatus Poribacteria bacterium]|nr:lactate racemase domain-containing protein [Candidatus Poribacteria bacterium]
MALPKMIRIKQHFDAPVVADLPTAIAAELDQIDAASIVKHGDSVAIGAGSRGVANIAVAVKATVDYLKGLGAKPFIVPAMGSHGGATPEGQRSLLEHYGITKETVGAPIKATMDVVEVGQTADGLPVFLDRYATEADHIVPINRIKAHTDFSGSIESGLMKMMAIGFGKQRGANMYHRAFFHYGFEHVIRTVCSLVLETGKIAFGVGLVENAHEQTAKVAAIRSGELIRRERELLVESKSLMGRLPFDAMDLLIVDAMGKNISGTGMDTNVIGRMMQNFEPEPEKPAILRIFVRDLTSESDGNATGIGLADFTTTRLVESIDRHAMYMNCITALGPQKSRIPFYYDTDREAIEVALNTIGLTPPEEGKVVRIESTLHLTAVDISEALLEDAQLHSDLEVIGELKPFAFDSSGNLSPFGTK